MSGEQLASAPIRIFIIDDHPTIIWGLERLIESEQPRMVMVGKATGSASAMLLIEQAQPDVVLLDLDLGKENGLDSIPEILKKSTAKILVLTGVRDTSAHEAAIRAGALGVVGKEIASAELLQAIERVHRGELSVNRQTTERLLATISRKPATVGQFRKGEDGESDCARARHCAEPDAPAAAPSQRGSRVARHFGADASQSSELHLRKARRLGRLELYVVSSKQTADKYKQ